MVFRSALVAAISFGCPDLRIRTKYTTGNIFALVFDDNIDKSLEWLSSSDEKIKQLLKILQQSIGRKNVYIENLTICRNSEKTCGSNILEIQLRYPFSIDDNLIELQLITLAEKWIIETRGD